MILESTQLLNNALIKADENYSPIYNLTHKNHPCSLWTAASDANFEWLNDLALNLCEEYTYRYGKIHKCFPYIKSMRASPSRIKLPDIEQTPFAKCMPDQYKVEDAVESYRNYYRADKAYIAKWTKRPIPEWWNK